MDQKMDKHAHIMDQKLENHMHAVAQNLEQNGQHTERILKENAKLLEEMVAKLLNENAKVGVGNDNSEIVQAQIEHAVGETRTQVEGMVVALREDTIKVVQSLSEAQINS